jgi:hypothetical protein
MSPVPSSSEDSVWSSGHDNPSRGGHLSPNTGEVLRIVVPLGGTQPGIKAAFDGDTPNATAQQFVGRYVWHCHILEREENDMMQSYTITP